MDKLRQLVTERIEAAGLNPRRLSLMLKRHPGYMHEWLSGKQSSLPHEVKMALASALKIDPLMLGATLQPPNATPPTGFSDDAKPYLPPSGSMLATVQHIMYYEMTSRALDQHERRIMPGQVLGFDINQANPAQIKTGQIVIVQMLSKADFIESKGSLVRMFVEPNKLITNSSGPNEIISLDDASLSFEPVIKGTMVGVFDAVPIR
jgi:hypothetical protein